MVLSTNTLNDQNKEIFYHIFGIKTKRKTMPEIANDFELTAEQIRHRYHKIIRNIQRDSDNIKIWLKIQEKAKQGFILDEQNFTFDDCFNDVVMSKICPNVRIIKSSTLKHGWLVSENLYPSTQRLICTMKKLNDALCFRMPLISLLKSINFDTTDTLTYQFLLDCKYCHKKENGDYYLYSNRPIVEQIESFLRTIEGCVFVENMSQFLEIDIETIRKTIENYELYGYDLIEDGKIIINQDKNTSIITQLVYLMLRLDTRSLSITDIEKCLSDNTNIFTKESNNNYDFYYLKSHNEFLNVCLKFFIDEEIDYNKCFNITEITKKLNERGDLFTKEEENGKVVYRLRRRAKNVNINLNINYL